MLAEPRASAPQTSQLLRGHHADVLDTVDAWKQIRGVDGYDGWCHTGYLTETPYDGTILRSAWSDERRMSLGCAVRRSDVSRMSLPVGALLDPDDVVVTGLAMNARGRARYFAGDTQVMVRRAIELFAGTPYQWGGVTPWGADCSGFVQTVFALHGMQLPRDAWQQAERGIDVRGEASDHRAADLLFFSDRDDAKITHVAMSLGGDTIIHCSLANGGFGTDVLSASTAVAEQLRRTFRFAKRVM